MDDKVLFSRSQVPTGQSQPVAHPTNISQQHAHAGLQQSPPHPTSHADSPLTPPSAPPLVSTGKVAPLSPPSHNPPPPPRRGGFNKSIFIRLGLVLGGLLLLLFIIFSVILPRMQKPENVELTFWGLYEDPKAMQAVITDFEKKHPTIKVSYAKQDIKQYRERLTTRIPAGGGPDIYYFHNTWTNMIGGYLTPLPTDIMTQATFRDTYYPVMQTDLVRNGAIYGIPLGIDTLSLFVNTQIQKAGGVEVPQNWDDFDKAAKKLTVKDETGKITTAGVAMGTVDNVTRGYDVLSLLFVQNGVNLPEMINYPEQVAGALEYYTQYAMGNENVWDNTLDPALLAFATGKVAFYFGYSWDILNIRQLNSSLEYTIHPVPSLPTRNISIASYWAAGVSNKSRHQDEALLFLQYLSEKQTAQKLYAEAAKVRGFGMPYARVDLAKSLENDPLVSPFVKQAPLALSTYFSSETYDNGINTKMNAYLANAVRFILAGNQPSSAAETFLQGVAQVQSEYGK